MTAAECRKPRPCLPDLADGWINPPDLCPTCTAAFMTALDSIAGPMTWHRTYTERTDR